MKTYNIEQKTDEWKLLRKGKITGTDLKRVMGTPRVRENVFYDILSERLSVGVDEESAVDHGNRLEAEAAEEFEKQTGLMVQKMGFCESDLNPYIGISPDGLIKKGKKYVGALETKCLSSANHVRAWLENKIPEEYYAQCLQYFIVNTDLQTLYFVLYDPRISVHPYHCIELYRKDLEDDIADYKHGQEEFLREIDEKLETILNQTF